MNPYVDLATVAKEADVERIGKNIGDTIFMEALVSTGENTLGFQKVRNIIKDRLIFCVQPECVGNDGRFLTVNDDFFDAHIIEVAHRCKAGKLAIAHFLAKASFSVFRQRVHVVFALPKRHIQHKFSLWRRLKPKRREFEGFDLTGVHTVDKPPAVDTIARKPVRMPGENAVDAPMLYALHHLIEYGTTGNLGGLFLDKLLNNMEMFSPGILAKLHQLRFDGQGLFVFHIRGLARIQKE